MSSRAEAFLSDSQARDTFTEAELALDAKGRFLALRVRHLANMGAYIGAGGAHTRTPNFAPSYPRRYDPTPPDGKRRCLLTNTTPTSAHSVARVPQPRTA